MQNKTLIFTILIAMTLVIPNVMAAAAMTVPATNGNYTTTLNVALTTDNSVNMTNVTCLYNATGGATGTLLTSFLNTTAGQTTWSDAVDVSGFSDLTTYNMSCAVYNGTTLNSTLYASSVTIDNTDPTYTFVLSKPSNADLKGIQRLTWTTADATSGLSTVAVTVTSPNSDRCPVQSWSTTSGTDQKVKLDCTGSYTAEMTITDESGNSVTTTDPFKVRAPGYKTVSDDGTSMFGDFSIGGEGSEANGNLKVIAIIAIIILVIWGISKK